MQEIIRSTEDVLVMLDQWLKEGTTFEWDQFYSDRRRNVPFFENQPDENLVRHFSKGRFQSGMKILELGCGPGRNALFFAEKGCEVVAVDLSKEALRWAEERAKERELEVNFQHGSLFDLPVDEGGYDIVYDSGCFHHIAPHRRIDYLNLVKKALRPGGYYALVCFVPGGNLGGAEISDWDVYRLRSLRGGLGFTEERLRLIFDEYLVIEMKKMNGKTDDPVFSQQGLQTALFQK